MISSFIKLAANNAGKSAREAAKKMAKQIAAEPSELLKSAGTQISGNQNETQSKEQKNDVTDSGKELSVMQQVMTGNGRVQQPTKEEEINIHSQAKKRMQELEDEIMRMRQVREQKEQNWEKEQQQILGATPKEEEKKQPLIQPTSIRKRGMTAGTKQKQGTKEMTKQMSG